MAAQGAVSGSVTTSRTALIHADTLAAYLKDRLPHRRTDALTRLAEVLLGILQAESTLHRKIALHLPRTASLESKTRVVARVFHDEQLKPQDVLDVLLPLLPGGRLTMVMDRTNWHYGQTPLNLLVLGVALGGVVLPLVWTVLPHQGNSCSAARILLVAQLLKVLPAKRWAVLIADREFVGKEWCDYLRWRGIKRCFRIKENTRIDDELARDQFENLQPGEVRAVFEKAWVYGSLMQVVVTLSPAGERVVVASDLSVLDTLQTYQKRWGIETGQHDYGDTSRTSSVSIIEVALSIHRRWHRAPTGSALKALSRRTSASSAQMRQVPPRSSCSPFTTSRRSHVYNVTTGIFSAWASPSSVHQSPARGGRLAGTARPSVPFENCSPKR